MDDSSRTSYSATFENLMLRQRLTLRIEPYPDESLSPVLMCLIEANGFESIRALFRDTGRV